MSNLVKQLLHAGIAVPDLGDKVFYSIREVSDLCKIEPHVLRYWETEFHQLKPEKWNGNRRRYRQRDVFMIIQIRHLLHHLKFTIRGARRQIASGTPIPSGKQQDLRTQLSIVRSRLLIARELLSQP
ncbi:MAG: MerR family transcriptional regulator [Mariprofundales bacterium]|nr:MerR family transcriptional regulator [Mariprofundales bacterium]